MSLPQPIFILASQRSFTSIVCAMLGQHPQTYGVPEINLLIRETVQELVNASRGQSQFIIHGLWRTVAQLYAGEQTIQSIDLARRWLNKRLQSTTGEVYQELCAKVAPLRIVDKSPAYAENPEVMLRIREAFPEAHYLYLSRHPKDHGKSVLRSPQGIASLLNSDSLDYSVDPPSIDPQFAWYRTQKNILAFLETIPPERQMRLRGEDLLSQPRQYLEEICQWLDLNWSDEIYEVMLRTQESSFACMGPFGAQWGNHPGFQKSPAFRYRQVVPSKNEGALAWREDNQGLKSEVMALLEDLGYE